ncbi:MAG TPA: LD-carboxypeptidase, partial [Bacteroidia bacterium]|nr:LD-carboxypeptidase [Bacteroidia bacterium]
MLRPEHLRKGDTVAIVSTARKISAEEIQPAVDELTGWGLKVVSGQNLFSEQNQFAGSDEERLADFQNTLDDKNIKAILFARGGYGTVRIIDNLNWVAFTKKPKWLIGFSDITVIHSHVQKNCGVETLHAPMAFNFKNASKESISNLEKILFGENISYNIPENIFSDFNRYGNAKGILTGGNLSILYALNGTPSDIDYSGKILFIEDIDEYLYHIDRMMLTLKRAGKLKSLAGLIVGGMTDMKDNTVPFGKSAEEIIRESLAEYSYPICFGFPAGHIRDNRSLIFGREVELNVTEEIYLKY